MLCGVRPKAGLRADPFTQSCPVSITRNNNKLLRPAVNTDYTNMLLNLAA